ncbi:hypothetical protein ABIC28_005156 [Rhodococcus sp. PvR044]|uniref:hypothetical protein n=1 Tax=Rhodococcus sp. PvR044 TaxID=3156402 RepID=UPI00339123C5
MLSRTAHGPWAVQSGRMMLALPYAHVTEDSVIQRMFVGPGSRQRAERWVESRSENAQALTSENAAELRR